MQLGLFIAALVFGLRVLRARQLRARDAWLLALVALDPLLVHAQLSLMPDGLALTACVLVLAGWIEALRDGRLRG